MKIAIYGGTFDPPHLGHMEAASAALHTLSPDLLCLIPTQIPPHKPLPPDAANPQQRLAMCEIMADHLGKKTVKVLDLELQRQGASYTVDTICSLRETYGTEAELYLLMGSDMFLSFHKWKEAETLAREVTLVPFYREHEKPETAFAQQTQDLQTRFSAKMQCLPLTVQELSSSQIRADLASEQDKGAKGLLPAIYGYILRQGLYGTTPDYADLCQLRAVGESMIQAKRVRHVRGTEETAAALALVWGEDPTLARRAGILHDITKYWTLEENLALCAQYGITLDPLEAVSVKMQHSKTGAILAREQFHEAEAVWHAIERHTTGAPDMNTLDKILYLADYVEPTRDFEGLEELRQLAFSDLDRAMLLGLSMTMEELRQKEAPVHHNTQDLFALLQASLGKV